MGRPRGKGEGGVRGGGGRRVDGAQGGGNKDNKPSPRWEFHDSRRRGTGAAGRAPKVTASLLVEKKTKSIRVNT